MNHGLHQYKISLAQTFWPLCLFLFVCSPSLSFAESTWTLQLAALDARHQFQKIAGVQINSWSGEKIQVTFPNGKPATLSAAAVLSLTADSAVTSPSNDNDTWQLVLINGDVLYGSPTASTDSLVDFRTPDLGVVSVPLTSVAGIKRISAEPVTATQADHDTLYFSNGDTMTGSFDSINDKAVHWESSLGAIDIPLSRIDRVVLGLATLFKPASALQERTCFADGSQLTTSDLAFQNGEFSLNDPGGKTVRCAAGDLNTVAILNGQAIWLTDLEPSDYQLTTYFGQQWPYKLNQNVLGGPLTVNGELYDHGVGVHTGASLTFKLAGRFHWFVFTPAMDDSATGPGQARVIVTADNSQELYRSAVLAPGQPVRPVLLDVTNVDSITLAAQTTDRFDVLGRVDWLNAALLH